MDEPAVPYVCMETVRVEHDLPGEPADVFEWFVDPTMLAAWWPSEADTDPVVGGAYRMHWSGPDVTLRGQYLSVEPGVRLSFTWSWDHDDVPPRDVTIAFAVSARGTLVTVDHEAATADEGVDYADGWAHFLARLDTRLSDR